jgi:hypothetical protein
MCKQVGFLTEWQIYAQTLEQDAWKEAKIDKDKLDKMSGTSSRTSFSSSNCHVADY